MTKYEWESELKRNIHRLPKAEQERALEFYNELFEDKIESGLSESQIITEFGNPCDVADKILAEYGELRTDGTDEPIVPPVYKQKDETDEQPADAADQTARTGGLSKAAATADRVLWSIGRVLRVAVGAGLWTAAVLAVAAAWILLAGGLALTVISLCFLAANALGAIANAGVGLLLAAVGLFAAAFTKRLLRWCRRTARVLWGKTEEAQA